MQIQVAERRLDPGSNPAWGRNLYGTLWTRYKPPHGFTTNSRAASSVRSSTTSVGPTQGVIPEEGGWKKKERKRGQRERERESETKIRSIFKYPFCLWHIWSCSFIEPLGHQSFHHGLMSLQGSAWAFTFHKSNGSWPSNILIHVIWGPSKYQTII